MTNTDKDASDLVVFDVDQPFPPMAPGSAGVTSMPTVPGDMAPGVRDVIRSVLGWRPRVEDPKAFADALTSSFRLTQVEGHVESVYVPRGYAVQADLGSITGGQASLYRRAMLARTETLRLLDALTPLRVDADREDMEAFRGLVRGGIEGAVAELGNPGGPRLPIVDSYLRALTGLKPSTEVTYPSPDAITGQLGQLRDQFGLIDANVNTIAEEEVRTSFWTLTDLVTDLHKAWDSNRKRFAQDGANNGFLGTDLIVLSRLMDAAVDQVLELEAVLDSVLIPVSERQTITLNPSDNLTLDGLLSWLRTFLAEEARHIAQDAGRDGIVSGLTPTINDLVSSFEQNLACHVLRPFDLGDALSDILQSQSQGEVPPRGKPALPSFRVEIPCVTLGRSAPKLPAGMFAARAKVAVDGLRRLLHELATTAHRISRFPGVVLFDATFSPLLPRRDKDLEFVRVDVRGLNIRPSQIPAFRYRGDLIEPVSGKASVDADSMSAIFDSSALSKVLPEHSNLLAGTSPITVPTDSLDIAVVDANLGELDDHDSARFVSNPMRTSPINAVPDLKAVALAAMEAKARFAEATQRMADLEAEGDRLKAIIDHPECRPSNALTAVRNQRAELDPLIGVAESEKDQAKARFDVASAAFNAVVTEVLTNVSASGTNSGRDGE